MNDVNRATLAARWTVPRQPAILTICKSTGVAVSSLLLLSLLVRIVGALGKIVIQPFRDHHVHPQRITRYRFIEQDTTNFFLLLAPLALAFWLVAPRPGSVGELFWCCVLAGLSTGSFGTNLFHKWAHARKAPVVVRWLQQSSLVLGPERHQHHHGDYSRGFCVTSGWMNPLLDAIRFFPRIERVVRFFQR